MTAEEVRKIVTLIWLASGAVLAILATIVVACKTGTPFVSIGFVVALLGTTFITLALFGFYVLVCHVMLMGSRALLRSRKDIMESSNNVVVKFVAWLMS